MNKCEQDGFPATYAVRMKDNQEEEILLCAECARPYMVIGSDMISARYVGMFQFDLNPSKE